MAWKWVFACLLLGSTASWAQAPQSATFKAAQSCPAFQSFRKQTNPGSVSVVPGRVYRVLGQPSSDGAYVRVEIEDATPRMRWVPASCGALADGSGGDAASAAPSSRPAEGVRATYVLALGWEPQFCQTHRRKAECVEELPQDTTQLSLHGLWPQPIGRFYCGVSDRSLIQADKESDWDRLPEPQISAGTRARLARVMPGVQSELERHEWIKHGTCTGLSPDAYFNRAAQLAEQVNASPVRALVVGSVGRTLSVDQLRDAFDHAFGTGAGSRVMLSCNRGPRPEVQEIVVSLAGNVTGDANLADLIQAASPSPAGCPGGAVVPAGR